MLGTRELETNWQVAALAGKDHLVFVAPVPLDKQTPFLRICDKNAKEVRRIPGTEVRCDLAYFNWIQEQSGRIYYKEEFSDTLFYLNEKMDVHPYARIDLGKYKFQPSYFTMERMSEWPKYYRLNGIFDFNNSMVLNVQGGLMDQQKSDAYLFDKRKGQVGIFEKNINHNGFRIDGIVYTPEAVSGHRLISVIAATDLTGGQKIGDPELQRIALQIHENSNPVLAIMYMKE